MTGHIAIKGTRNGLLLTLEPATPFSDLIAALAGRLAESPSFFRGASLTVDTTQRSLRNNERVQLEDLLARYHMSVSAVETVADKRRAARTISLPSPDTGIEATVTKEIAPTPIVPTQIASTPIAPTPVEQNGQVQKDARDSMDTLFLRRTVRSGQAIHHQSNVVVLGDVNPGAEIVAGGDIIVWGVLRGMVHAGYPDNENAIVCSLQLSPVQLRIAHLLSRPPEGFEAQPRPEVATIRQGQIVVETWVSGRPPRK
ncbi:putative septum site-determining protein MinC [Dictyobacter vulcani]|uniref:Probable septum site-determining protein MinC n=1 Tax=Dictyobacter vulcani TaxID=2607529 RepID=A0A5J4KM55_9CHLR|nr:septum site-determining protein MinC [Dictyobacter vulcani]GER87331.1 putative septum site-determining protein MinC [Dictyobacter vulcani]